MNEFNVYRILLTLQEINKPILHAFDWLNDVTHEDTRFFAVEAELWRIGASPVAPKFNIVAKPSDWSKSVKEGRRAGDRRRSTGSSGGSSGRSSSAFWSAREAVSRASGHRVGTTG